MATKAQSKQSGGGSATAAETIDDTIKSFEPTVLGCLKELWKTTDHKKFPDLPSYLKYMSSSESNATLPALPTSLKEPLSSYFISASHNTYLTGHQLYGSANVDGYKNVSSIQNPRTPLSALTLDVHIHQSTSYNHCAASRDGGCPWYDCRSNMAADLSRFYSVVADALKLIAGMATRTTILSSKSVKQRPLKRQS